MTALDPRKVTYAQLRASIPPLKATSDARVLWVWAVIRPLSFPTAWVLMRLHLTANTVTALSMATNVAAAWVVIRGGTGALVTAALLYNLALLLDSADGNMARVTGTTSAEGWLVDTMAADLFYALFYFPLGIAAGQVVAPELLGVNPGLYPILGACASLGALYYRITRYRIAHAAHQAEAPKGGMAPAPVTPFGGRRELLYRLYLNLFTPGGVLLPGILLVAVFGGLRHWVLFYGIAAPAAGLTLVGYHVFRFRARVRQRSDET